MRRADGNIETTVYRTPTTTDRIMKYSNHPKCHRKITYCSTVELWKTERQTQTCPFQTDNHRASSTLALGIARNLKRTQKHSHTITQTGGYRMSAKTVGYPNRSKTHRDSDVHLDQRQTSLGLSPSIRSSLRHSMHGV